MIAPILNDYSNRKGHPFTEFPEGFALTSMDENGDSTLVKGNYGIVYSDTNITDILGDVVIKNYKDKITLVTDQMYWDQATNYFYTEKPFTLTTLTDTIHGIGFESDGALKHWVMKNTSGIINTKE